MDIVSKERRSRIMSRIKGRDTQCELAVRRLIHRMGFRFRLHSKDLPGRPDIVLPRHRKVVFVHGCFWHRHARCRYAYNPKSNVHHWRAKFSSNVERDRETLKLLRRKKWDALVIWECEIADESGVRKALARFLACPSDGGTVVL